MTHLDELKQILSVSKLDKQTKELILAAYALGITTGKIEQTELIEQVAHEIDEDLPF